MADWILLQDNPTIVGPPAVPEEPIWMGLGIPLYVPITPIIFPNDWVELQPIMIVVNPLTPIGDWVMLESMGISMGGEPVPPPEPVLGKINWLLWGGVAMLVVVIAIAVIRRR